jgi:hypothetical protein
METTRNIVSRLFGRIRASNNGGATNDVCPEKLQQDNHRLRRSKSATAPKPKTKHDRCRHRRAVTMTSISEVQTQSSASDSSNEEGSRNSFENLRNVIPRTLGLSLVWNTTERPGRRGRRKGDRVGLFDPDNWRNKKQFRQLDEVPPAAVERELFRRLRRYGK